MMEHYIHHSYNDEHDDELPETKSKNTTTGMQRISRQVFMCCTPNKNNTLNLHRKHTHTHKPRYIIKKYGW